MNIKPLQHIQLLHITLMGVMALTRFDHFGCIFIAGCLTRGIFSGRNGIQQSLVFCFVIA